MSIAEVFEVNLKDEEFRSEMLYSSMNWKCGMGNLVMNTMFKKILLCNRARLGLLRKKIFLNNILEVQNSTRQEKGWWESEAASLTCYKIDAWTTSHY